MITKVTSLLGSWVVLLGAWQASAAEIAFASNRRGHGYQIFAMDADGANPRAATLEGELIRVPGCFLIASCGFV
jgi:Tol biopolymer transport system component